MNQRTLRELVIQPTLETLGVDSLFTETLLLNTALAESGLDPLPNIPSTGCSPNEHEQFGIYKISHKRHQSVWDQWLAFKPDVASRVRGLASQRAFLINPDRELITNLSYATAVAWSIYQQAGIAEATTKDVEALWQTYYRAGEIASPVMAWQEAAPALSVAA